MRDPYIIFAKHILKLKPLEELNRKPGIIDLGIIVHAVLEKFNRRFPGQLPDNAEEILSQIGRQEFAAAGIDEQTLAFWAPALDKIVRWVSDKENGLPPGNFPASSAKPKAVTTSKRRAELSPSAPEPTAST